MTPPWLISDLVVASSDLECERNKISIMPFARLFFSVAFATMLYSPFVHAIPIPKATSGRISLPIEQWLSDGERKTFKWKLNVSHPELTFQQRYRVWVTASVDTESLQARSIQRE